MAFDPSLNNQPHTPYKKAYALGCSRGGILAHTSPNVDERSSHRMEHSILLRVWMDPTCENSR